jgi:hypothetical protein
VYEWAFKDDDSGCWYTQGLDVAGVPTGLHASLLIEQAYLRRNVDKKNFTLKIGRYTYAYYFNAEPMYQRNCQVEVFFFFFFF